MRHAFGRYSRSLAIAALAGTPLAHAQTITPDPGNLFTPFVGVQYLNDDNLFRLPNGVSPSISAGASRGDQAWISDFGLLFNKTYGQQKITISADISDNRYDTFSYLDFVAKNGSATWSWTLTPEITGHVIYSRSQFLNSFADFNSFGRNINTNTTKRIDLDWAVAGALHTGIAATQFVQTNTLPVFEFENVRVNSIEPNINLISLASNSIGAYGRTATGQYVDQALDPVNQIDTNFREHEFGLRSTYGFDGQLSFFGQLGYLKRENEHFHSRDLGGLVGTTKIDWQMTGKTTANILFSRSLSTYETLTTSYVTTERISLGPTWSATAKTQFTAAAQVIRYQFAGPLVPTSSLRADLTRELVLGGQWTPVREVTVTPSLTFSARHSNELNLQYQDRLFTILAKFSF